MCGICGEIRFDNLEINRQTAKKMINAVARRGPDNEGLYFNKHVFLGHRRLSVIDITERSNQPMTCLLYTSPSPRDATLSRMPSSA